MPLKTFTFEGKEQPVIFIETMKVTDGVDCDVYTFDNDTTKDLGIIRIQPGKKTPLQKVLKGDRTIEGYISGKGILVITKPDKTKNIYPVGESDQLKSINVAIDELMQWQADANSPLTAYEICFPPYKDGRFENIEE